MTELLHLQKRGEISSWIIRFCYADTANEMKCIYPSRTLVKIIGLDNTGTHSKPEPERFGFIVAATTSQTWSTSVSCRCSPYPVGPAS
jgi:hypothetical protein